MKVKVEIVKGVIACDVFACGDVWVYNFGGDDGGVGLVMEKH